MESWFTSAAQVLMRSSQTMGMQAQIRIQNDVIGRGQNFNLWNTSRKRVCTLHNLKFYTHEPNPPTRNNQEAIQPPKVMYMYMIIGRNGKLMQH